MGLIILAAWVATFAIGGVLQASSYFLTPQESSLTLALGGVVLAIVGFTTFWGLIKKRPWALASFIVLGFFSMAQFYVIRIMPLEAPTEGDWFRLVAAGGIYTLVALYVKKKLAEPDKKEPVEMES